MPNVGVVIEQAAAATSLEELGEFALPALASALAACPVFMAQSASELARSRAIAGEGRKLLGGYLAHHVQDDPLGQVACTTTEAVSVLQRHVDPQRLHASRAWQEFHRQMDFEHHMVVRFAGATVLSEGALTIGLTRGRRQACFDAADVEIARSVLPAFRGAARRLAGHGATPDHLLEIAAAHRLTPCETQVLARLALGLSNAEIAERLFVSGETVKTHLSRIYRKLGVATRTAAIARLAH